MCVPGVRAKPGVRFLPEPTPDLLPGPRKGRYVVRPSFQGRDDQGRGGEFLAAASCCGGRSVFVPCHWCAQLRSSNFCLPCACMYTAQKCPTPFARVRPASRFIARLEITCWTLCICICMVRPTQVQQLLFTVLVHTTA